MRNGHRFLIDTGRLSKQRVDEWCQTGAGEKYQCREDKKRYDDGQQPPFLVVFQKAPKFPEKTGAGISRSGLFELTGLAFFHSFAKVIPAFSVLFQIIFGRWRVVTLHPETLLSGWPPQLQRIAAGQAADECDGRQHDIEHHRQHQLHHDPTKGGGCDRRTDKQFSNG